ncbi:MAG TPA: S41 family peptidase [Bacteroidota bacterium]|jgi:carboxyl-terminal processing protease|nr:S41 family peptidase [Bacteroidota bacterium]
MKYIVTKKIKTLFLGFGLLIAACLVGFRLADTDYFFKINKSIDIFGRVYKEVTLNYVDEVDPEKFMESGIDGLLSTLDPYTNFIDEHEGDEVELITTGKYGGIGVTIGQREGFITILTLMEGYSAQRQGIQPGDRVLEIDGKSLIGMKPEGVRSLTRGEPGTDIRLKIEREGELKPLDFVLVREEIQLKNISFADFISEGTAYIRIDRFSRSAGDELRLAIKDLRLKGAINKVILDLRDNPGGLLDVAVSVVEKFVPKGSLVVSTRGRKPESEKKYFATEEPMLPDVPLVVLVNRNSASASEIVAGAIHDLDRGIILGTRSFGKGLVQTITPLPYNTQLKITTAKYYTPSGRCIQEIDYMHKGADGVFAITPDSLRQQFKTLKGRPEYERGGITPDTLVAEPEPSALHKELLRKAMYFKFATRYIGSHKELPALFDDEDLARSFHAFLEEQKFSYQDEGEAKLKELSEVVDKSKYSSSVTEIVDRLKAQIAGEKLTGIDRNKQEVLRALRMEIVSRYKGEHGRIDASLKGDIQIATGEGVLTNPKEYSRLLSGD